MRPEIAAKTSNTPAIAGNAHVTMSPPHRTRSTSLGLQVLSKNDCSGLKKRRMTNQPLPGSLWIQLPSATPSGFSGAKWIVVDPSASASAAGVG
jgi:hypothetical protein